jgi:transposase
MHPGCAISQVYLCRTPIDFRKGMSGLSVLVEQELRLNPFAQALFVFINRSRNKIKILYWHRNGFCLWMKRLEAEKFAWILADHDAQNEVHHSISMQELTMLLEGYNIWQNKPHRVLNFTSVS